MEYRMFSGCDQLPNEMASDEVMAGCMVLEGGAFRSVYGEGVLDALMTAGINLECTIGVSAGALNGINYVSGQIGRSARINLRYRHDRRYISWARIFQYGGPFNFDFALKHVPNDPLDEKRFFSQNRRFIAVATNCRNGKPVYFDRDSCKDIFAAIRASASMPYVSRIVPANGILCLDGGCSVKIPYQWAMKQDFSKIVIVRNRPADWRYPDEGPDKLARRYYHIYPQFAETLAWSHARYNRDCDEIARLEEKGRVFVITPSRDLPVRKMETDMEKLGELYYLGYEDGQNAIMALKDYLS